MQEKRLPSQFNFNEELKENPGYPHTSIRNSTTEVLTPISPTLVIENMTAVSTVLRPACDQSSDETDSSSTETFQFLASNAEDKVKGSRDFNFESTGTNKDKSDLEEIAHYSRNECMMTNVESCLVEDENDIIYHDEEFMTEPNFGQETLCSCTKTTVADVMFMCLVLGLRHNLSWEAQIDILKMFNAIY